MPGASRLRGGRSDWSSDEIVEKIEKARSRVSDIYGLGTTCRQSDEVKSFYRMLKSSLSDSLSEHLWGQVGRFAQILLNRANSIYPNIKQELELVIKDRLNAIHSNLDELNELQKADMIREFRQVIRSCESACKRIKPLLDPPDPAQAGNGALRVPVALASS